MGAGSSKRVTRIKCDPGGGDHGPVVSICAECREFYCSDCSEKHKAFQQTKTHKQAFIEGSSLSPEAVICVPCRVAARTPTAAMAVCVECREMYCYGCYSYHKKTKVSRDHTTIKLVPAITTDITQSYTASGGHGLPLTPSCPNYETAISNPSNELPPSYAQAMGKEGSSGPGPGSALTATYVTGFSSRIPSDTEQGKLEAHRLVTLPDDRVIIFDWVNSKLKLMSADFNCQHSIPTRSASCGLTLMDETTVAVSNLLGDISQYTIRGTRLQRSTSLRCDITDDERMMDIAYADDAFFCLLLFKETHRGVIKVTKSGQRTTVHKEPGKCTVLDHIIASDTGVCIASDSPNQVRCFSFQGELLWTVHMIAAPWGMTMVCGSLCVVAYGEKVIYQVSQDGMVYDNFVLEGLEAPYSVCYQRQRSNLLVSSYDDLSATVNVFTVVASTDKYM